MHNLCIFAVVLITEEMLMSTKNEKNQMQEQLDTQGVENATTVRTPSIWYT